MRRHRRAKKTTPKPSDGIRKPLLVKVDEAQFNLGVMYAEPWRAKRRRQSRRVIIRKPLIRATPMPQFNLGVAYDNGRGVPGKRQTAEWYQKAADQGYAAARFNLEDHLSRLHHAKRPTPLPSNAFRKTLL